MTNASPSAVSGAQHYLSGKPRALGRGKRIGVTSGVVLVIALLQQTAWVSITAFIAALVPATVGLLVVEMKLLSGRMQAGLWTDASAPREVTR